MHGAHDGASHSPLARDGRSKVDGRDLDRRCRKASCRGSEPGHPAVGELHHRGRIPIARVFQQVTSRMKILTLIRHAKSNWDDTALTDKERPLNKRGLHDAPAMGKRLAKHGVRPDLILSSP